MTDIHPYRKKFVEDLAGSVADFLDEGFELPFDEEIVRVGHERCAVNMVLPLVERDHCRLLTWLLRRYLKTLRVRR